MSTIGGLRLRRNLPAAAAGRVMEGTHFFRDNKILGIATVLVLAAVLLGLPLFILTENHRETNEKPAILILGARGFLGMSLARAVDRSSFSVHGVDLESPPGDRDATRLSVLVESQVELHSGDLLQAEFVVSVFRKVKPTIVVDFTQQELLGSDSVNQQLMSNVLGAAMSSRSLTRYVFASPNRFYMPSSRSAEKLVEKMIQEKKLNFDVMEWRFSTVYGPLGRQDMDYYRFTRGIFDGSRVMVAGDGVRYLQDYIHISDAVKSMKYWLTSPKLASESTRVVDIGTGRHPVSYYEVQHRLEQIIGKSMHYQYMLTNTLGPVEIPYVSPQHLGPVIFNSWPLDSGLRQFVDWYSIIHNKF